MSELLPTGSYPVMLTAFDADRRLDPAALESLVDWYVDAGSAGLFTNSRSSEFEYLEPAERLELSRTVVRLSRGRVPVVATGSLGRSAEEDADFILAMAETGVDAVVIITSHLGPREASESELITRLEVVLDRTGEVDLGFYECPTPWKRLLSDRLYGFAAQSQRFTFVKDTSHDQSIMARRVELAAGSRLRLFNAQTSSIIEGIALGTAGHSGISANLHPELVAWLCDPANADRPERQQVQDIVTMAEAMIGTGYPTSAKQYVAMARGLRLGTTSRMAPDGERDDHGLRPLQSLARSVQLIKERMGFND
ncbi:dihydrodipicolinate synthase family protein [Microlunatus sp. GCM10028923]|uniref:dihydrodipicolinate synthase family protein n=1 Tax=Microlunatus sp. GCM10028923 TaxID=3273400 RepID=UPI003609B13E